MRLLRRRGSAFLSIAFPSLSLYGQASIHPKAQPKQPLAFIENQGQWPTEELWRAQAGALRVSFLSTAFVLRNSTEPTAREQVVALAGSEPDMKIEGLDPVPAAFNFFIRSSELRLEWTAIR
jgi:hypothetical protein